jgi:starch phosphorylase
MLYGGDQRYRLCQEAILGLGGVAVLRTLGHERFGNYHMNEGHSALLALALLDELSPGEQKPTPEAIQAVRRQCVFTTHTPVPAGHDMFQTGLVHSTLGERLGRRLAELGCYPCGELNMTYLSLFFSHYVNGVSMRHENISQDMFPDYPVNAITNGIHAATWASDPFVRLFDRNMPEWRKDTLYLRYAVGIPLDEIREAHAEAKRMLLAEVERRAGRKLDPEALTIGFARRATPYKQPRLSFHSKDRLREIARTVGPLQMIFAGKAHPHDQHGKDLIRGIFQDAAELGTEVPVVYLEDYDMALGKLICSGVDVWLNTPTKPQEASGTSGMKAALNGVPSLSILDGWWIEGHVEGVTGWSVGESWRKEGNTDEEAASLYDKLETVIGPLFYQKPDEFARIRRSAIALNGSFFNAQRMLLQYVKNAYVPSE